VPVFGRKACPDYDRAWSLADAMPVNATAPVTARDKFVVAFTEEELCQRIEEFRDLSIPDEAIRRRYFTRTRSARHQSGDTRGWKLSAARRIIAADREWKSQIVRCLYRPFDWRFVFWHPAMIDWPRTEVTRHLVEGSGFGVQGSEKRGQRSEVGRQRLVQSTEYSVLGLQNGSPVHVSRSSEPRTPGTLWVREPLRLCLIARRQQLPTQPCTFFWVADGLALDGVIRSDNRGSESLFPLYLREAGGGGAASWRANFAPEFIQDISNYVRMAWLPLGRGDLLDTFGPEDLLAYIYALFHAPSYRERYADQLRVTFPRVVLPRNAEWFRGMCRVGSQLIQLHVSSEPEGTPYSVPSTEYSGVEDIDSALASFRVGGYTVLKKWLQPLHRSVGDPQFLQICGAISRTIELMKSIDESIATHGGFAERD
jgi:hypothetical protein